MKLLAVFAFLLVVSIVFGNQEWEEYKKKNGKVYKTAVEDSFRLKIYLDKKAKVDKHNVLYKKGLTTFTMGINRFTDMTDLEVAETMNGFRRPSNFHPRRLHQNKEGVSAPDSIDWRSYGYVTGVKDQAQCGSCWAFSTTGSLEGQHFAATGNLVSLSEQNLVDCSGPQGNAGCEGGWMDQAFTYIGQNGGIDTEDSYPYEAVDASCRFNPANIGATLWGYVDIAYGDENQLKESSGTVGPVSIAIDASQGSFNGYSGGIYYDANCNPDNLDHGVLIVGYGSENGQDYWIVKNSWGAAWGESGYIRMSRNAGNNCGVASAASYPLV